jgi:hypothetical protein
LPPLSSPKDGPPQSCLCPKTSPDCCIHPSRGGYPSPAHALRRLPARAYPRIPQVNDSPQPITHRLHPISAPRQRRSRISTELQCRFTSYTPRRVPWRSRPGGSGTATSNHPIALPERSRKQEHVPPIMRPGGRHHLHVLLDLVHGLADQELTAALHLGSRQSPPPRRPGIRQPSTSGSSLPTPTHRFVRLSNLLPTYLPTDICWR